MKQELLLCNNDKLEDHLAGEAVGGGLGGHVGPPRCRGAVVDNTGEGIALIKLYPRDVHLASLREFPACTLCYLIRMTNSPQSLISMSPLFLRSIVKAEAETARKARLRNVFMLTE